MTRYELIKKHKEAFNEFARAGIDPCSHHAYLDMYEEKRRLKELYGRGYVNMTARQFSCSRETIRRASVFLMTEI